MVIKRIPDPTLQQPIKTIFKEPEPTPRLKKILDKIQPREKPVSKPAPKPIPIPIPTPIPASELEQDDYMSFADHLPDIKRPAEWERHLPEDYPKPKQSIDLFEEAQQLRQDRGSTIVHREPLSEEVAKESIPLKNIAGIIIGIGLLAFGIWNSGGFYETSSRLSGDLAVFFYVWQIGNLLQIGGAITLYHNLLKLYDSIKRKISDRETD